MGSTKGYTPSIEDNMIKCLLSLPKNNNFMTNKQQIREVLQQLRRQFLHHPKVPICKPNNASKKKFKSPKKQDSKDILSLA